MEPRSPDPLPRDDAIRRKNRRLGLVVAAVVVGMVGFAGALIPLYNMLCKAGGIPTLQLDTRSGKGPSPGGRQLAPVVAQAGANTRSEAATRMVTVRWWGVAQSGVPVRIEALDPSVRQPIGATRQVMFRFTNVSDHTVTFQAIHSTDPEAAEAYVTRTVCFCFTRQQLKPHQTRELPVVYSVGAGLPESIHTIDVGYSLFGVGKSSGQG